MYGGEALNRRDFLKGIGVGVGAAGIATVVRVSNEIPALPPVPTFDSLNELWPLMEMIGGRKPRYPEDVAVVLKAFQYATALPDNPMAVLPVFCICRLVIMPSHNSNFKAACINSPEFIAVVEKFGKYIP